MASVNWWRTLLIGLALVVTLAALALADSPSPAPPAVARLDVEPDHPARDAAAATATRLPTRTRTATRTRPPTRTPTVTRTRPPTRTATSTRTPRASPSPTGSRTPTSTPRPRPSLEPTAIPLTLEPLPARLSQPLHVTHAGDGSGRLFVVEKGGRIIVIRDGAQLPTPFLDITPLVRSSGAEQGLLSLAFHPRYAENGRFFVAYTDHNHALVVARYQVSAEPDVADPRSGRVLLRISKPTAVHNGGLVTFGPDGYLYVGVGDGGIFGDPQRLAQSPRSLLGKILRLDIDRGLLYGIPPDNPFVGQRGARPEVWALGLRNPWRFSFDRATGDLYIADVGQSSWEEIDFQPAGLPGGQNYGWSFMEGRHCFPPGASCDPGGFTLPIAEYSHALGCSVTGGHVYRGAAFPELWGLYLFGDFCSGRIWALDQPSSGTWRMTELLDTSLRISSFGEDEAGEIYVTGLSDGTLARLAVAR